MPMSRAVVTTQSPSLNIKKLCRHFSHKAEVRFDDTSADIQFPFGEGRCLAQEGVLIMEVEAMDDDLLARAEHVMSDHLIRFAHRESLSVEWHRQT